MQVLQRSQQSIEDMRELILRDAKNAHKLFRKAHVLEAMELYRKILKRNFIILFDPVSISRDSEQSSLFIDLMYYISSYYIHGRDWQEFSRLYTIYSSHIANASPISDKMVWIETVNIFNRTFHNGNLEEITQQAEDFLALPGLSTITRTLLHYVLTQTKRLLRNEKMALFHSNQCLAMVSLEEEPYFYIFFLEGQAAIYYFLNQGREDYHHKAIELWNKAEYLAREVADGYDFTHNSYNVGWGEAELGNYDKAQEQFEQGLAEAIDSGETHIQSLYYYGLGYISFINEDYSLALQKLQKALNHFVSTSYLMTGVCLYILAKCYTATGDYASALDRLENSLDNLRKVQNPVQLSHTYRQLSVVYRKDGQYWNALRYFCKNYSLRIRYKMPLFPY